MMFYNFKMFFSFQAEWFRNGDKLFPTERIKMDREGSGLLRLSILGVDPADVGKYSCRIFNPHGEDICHAELSYDCKFCFIIK